MGRMTTTPTTTPTLTINVIGTPAPQGSKRAFVVNGHAVMTESSSKVKPWRQDVVAATHNTIATTGWQQPAGPVTVQICFYLPRLKGHYGTGRNANHLKQSAPTHSCTKPDIDKLARATLDALTTSAAIKDDSQVARLSLEKRYADAATGARITITPLCDNTACQVEALL